MPDRLKTVAVIGAGPAGLSAALWLRQLGLEPIVIEREAQAGGMLRFNFLANEWVLGQRGLTGTAMSERFIAHVADHAIPILLERRITRFVPTPAGWRLHFAGNADPLAVRAVVVATGLRYRGVESLAGVRGLATLDKEQLACGPFAFVDLEAWRGAAVLIVGGGDNAFENALRLVALGVEVVVLCRSRPRAQQQFQEALAGSATVVEGAMLCEVQGDGRRFLARWKSPAGEATRAFDRLHVLTGYAPNTEWLLEALGEASAGISLTPQGYLVTNSWGRTGLPLLYGAGDLTDPDFPSVVSAVAAGAKAAKAIERELRDRG